jgi:anti-sigma factor RsiW
LWQSTKGGAGKGRKGKVKAMDAEFKSSACLSYEVWLEDYLSGDLGSADAKKVDEHLESCAGCRAALDRASASARLLRVLEPALDPGSGFARVVMGRIRTRQAPEEKGLWEPFISLAWRVTATATLALALMVTYSLTSKARSQQGMAVARQTETGDIFSSDAPNVPVSGDDVLIMVAEANHGNH